MIYRLSDREMTAEISGVSLSFSISSVSGDFFSAECLGAVSGGDFRAEGGLYCSASFSSPEGKDKGGRAVFALYPGHPAMTLLFRLREKPVRFRLVPAEGTEMRLLRRFPVGEYTRDVFLFTRGRKTLLLLAEGQCDRGGEIVFPEGFGQLCVSLGPIGRSAGLLLSMRDEAGAFYLLRRLPENRVCKTCRTLLKTRAESVISALPASFAGSRDGKHLIREASELLGRLADLNYGKRFDLRDALPAFFFLLSLGQKKEAKQIAVSYASLVGRHGFYPVLPRFAPLEEEEKASMRSSGAALAFLLMLSASGDTKLYFKTAPLPEEAYRTVLASFIGRALPTAFPETACGEESEWGDALQTALFLSLMPALCRAFPEKETQILRMKKETEEAFPALFLPENILLSSSPERASIGYRRRSVYAKCPCCGVPAELLYRKNVGYRCVFCLEGKEKHRPEPAFSAKAFLAVRALVPSLLPPETIADGMRRIGNGKTLSDGEFALLLSQEEDSALFRTGMKRLEKRNSPLSERLLLCAALLKTARKNRSGD